MKKIIVQVGVLISVLSLGACSTMYIHNGPIDENSNLEYSEWHHGGILRLVEFSDPVNLPQRCNKADWRTVKVERTFVQGLVHSVSYGIYDPWNVEYSCRE